MSDPLVFVAGSVVFIVTAWAVFAFGLARFDELAQRDRQSEPTITSSEQDQP